VWVDGETQRVALGWHGSAPSGRRKHPSSCEWHGCPRSEFISRRGAGPAEPRTEYIIVGGDGLGRPFRALGWGSMGRPSALRWAGVVLPLRGAGKPAANPADGLSSPRLCASARDLSVIPIQFPAHPHSRARGAELAENQASVRQIVCLSPRLCAHVPRTRGPRETSPIFRSIIAPDPATY
jgi:hypothetical protein